MKQSIFGLLIIAFLASCMPQAHAPAPKAKQTKSSPLIAQAPSKVVSRGAVLPETPVIKVALLVPLSGEAAPIGKSMVDAATLALYDTYLNAPSDEIKAQIILMPKNSGNTLKENVAAAKQAVAQGAQFVIGPLFSQSVTTIAPILKEKKIGMISFSNNKAVAAENVYTFGFLPEQQVERMAEYAYLEKMQRVALLAPNDAYGEKVRDTLGEIYLKKGGLVAPSELYAPSANNIEAAVLRIAAAYNNAPEDRRFQAIFVADSGNQMKNIVKYLVKSHIDLTKIKLIGTGLMGDNGLEKIPELQGAWFPNSPVAPYNVFAKRFANTYGYNPVRLASLAYDATSIIAKIAMKGEGINAGALTDPNGFYDTANGLVRLLPNGKSERKLEVVELHAQGQEVLDSAPKSFVDK